MLTEDTQTFDTVQEIVEYRREQREQAAQTQEAETEEVVDEPETEEIEAETEEVEADQEISEDDPSEEVDLEASEEDSEEVDETEEAEPAPEVPAVEPPQHLKGEEREQFTKLTPEAQAIVTRLAKNGEAVVTKKSQELSQTRQQLEQRLEGLGDFISETEQALQHYENVDWVAAYNQCETAQDTAQVNAHKAQYENLQKRLTEAKQKQGEAEIAEHQTFVSERTSRLSELSEESPIAKALVDPKEGINRQKEVFAYMQKNGMTHDTLLWVPAEGLTMAYKAMMYDRGNAKAKELPKKQSATPKAPAPKVVKSTSAASQGSSTSKRLSQLQGKSELSASEFKELQRLKRSKRK